MTHLSIIIPAYNEEYRIGTTLAKIHKFLLKKNYSFEIVLVDDGSADGTIAEARKSDLAKNGSLRVINNGKNRGKGYSVKEGILNSSGEHILFSDADLSTPIEELDSLFLYMRGGHDIVIGSRALKDSSVKIHQPWHREMMGKCFNLFVKSLLIGSFRDTQCGFKLFRGNVARDVARHMRINGFAFDVEMLYIAKAKGYKVKETGVVWENSTDSKVKLFHSPISMFFDLFRIKWIHREFKIS